MPSVRDTPDAPTRCPDTLNSTDTQPPTLDTNGYLPAVRLLGSCGGGARARWNACARADAHTSRTRPASRSAEVKEQWLTMGR